MRLDIEDPLRSGLEDLSWSSLSAREKLVVADILESGARTVRGAHLVDVVRDLRYEALERLVSPIFLTPLQNRAVAQALERRADAVEAAAERLADSPAAARAGLYAAGFLHSLVDRLVKGPQGDPSGGRDLITQLLKLEHPSGLPLNELAQRMVHSAMVRLEPFGLATTFYPVLEEVALDAAELAVVEPASPPPPPPDDDAFEFEIVDAVEERRQVAKAAFDAAVMSLWEDDEGWNRFLADLTSGRVKGCAAAPEHPVAAAKAASIALILTTLLRSHLRSMASRPWEAVSPGLKAILDRYPALKRREMLRLFVRHHVRKHYGILPPRAR